MRGFSDLFKVRAMLELKPSSLFRRIMSDSGVGDPAWKRATIVASVMGVGILQALPDVWTRLAPLLKFH